jgi:hypothetical protein
MTDARQRQDGNGNDIRQRREDRDPWMRLSHALERYKILWIVALGVSAWLGSRIIQPLNQVTVLTAQAERVLNRLDKADEDRTKMDNVVAILVRMQCLQLDDRDRAKINLDCRDIPLPTLRP